MRSSTLAAIAATCLTACNLPDTLPVDDAGLQMGATGGGEVNGDTGGTGGGGLGHIDGGLPSADAGYHDAGEFDAGEVDAGAVDAGEVDAGKPDAGHLFAPFRIYALGTNNDLYAYDTSANALVAIPVSCSTTMNLGNLALASTGMIYATGQDPLGIAPPQLYQINPTVPSCTVLPSIGVYGPATVAPSGVLGALETLVWANGNTFMSFSLSSLTSSTVGPMGFAAGAGLPRSLTYNGNAGGKLFVLAKHITGKLHVFEADPMTGHISSMKPTPVADLSVASLAYANGVLYGFGAFYDSHATPDLVPAIYVIDQTTGQATRVSGVTGPQPWGAFSMATSRP